MTIDIDSKMSENYNKAKFIKMKKIWPNALKSAIKFVQIEFNKNILDGFVQIFNSNINEKPIKNKVITRSK